MMLKAMKRIVGMVLSHSEPGMVEAWYRTIPKRTSEQGPEFSRARRIPPLSGKEWVLTSFS